jgi:hypothetical protein
MIAHAREPASPHCGGSGEKHPVSFQPTARHQNPATTELPTSSCLGHVPFASGRTNKSQTAKSVRPCIAILRYVVTDGLSTFSQRAYRRLGARLSSRLRVVSCLTVPVINPTHDQPLCMFMRRQPRGECALMPRTARLARQGIAAHGALRPTSDGDLQRAGRTGPTQAQPRAASFDRITLSNQGSQGERAPRRSFVASSGV